MKFENNFERNEHFLCTMDEYLKKNLRIVEKIIFKKNLLHFVFLYVKLLFKIHWNGMKRIHSSESYVKCMFVPNCFGIVIEWRFGE